jgi:hypothetical protein
MTSDMDDMPIELQTPENIICSFLDNGQLGLELIHCLKEFGFVIVKKEEDNPWDDIFKNKRE